MKIFKTVKDMQSWSWALRMRGRTLGFVPTMGALHEGHLALVERALRHNAACVVSIYVNPLQFGPQEDFRRYPRPLNKDLALLREAGVHAVFVPSDAEMYPAGFSSVVNVSGVSEPLEGARRPGHFKGVATVVAKLFAIVQPTRAYFGNKDYQQLRVIDRMAQDLNLMVKVVACPTVREADGLARSSRNRFLSRRQRQEAVRIHQALYLGRELISRGIMKTGRQIAARLTPILKQIPQSRVDYVAVVDPATLEPMTRIRRPALLAAAVRVGRTRLIDNLVVD